MRVKLFRAGSTALAMAQIRAELGEEALILSTRRTAGGVEVTAALEAAEPPSRPPRADLAYHALPEPIASRLAGGDLAAALPRILRFAALPLADGGPPLMLVGPPGAGKTLSVARLATRLVMAGGKPMVITADGRRAGAAEELAAYTRLLGLTLIVAGTPAMLARALQRRPPGSAVLIDTAGVNPFDAAELGSLPPLAQVAQAGMALVLPAGQEPLEAAEQASAFARAGARWLLPTRLDHARRLGSVLAAAIAGGLALTEAGVGAGAADGLAPLTPDVLAARLACGQSPMESAA